MDSNTSYSEEYKEKQASGALQKKYLERSYKIARSMFDSLPPKNSSLFHPRQHDDKIEIEVTTIRANSRSVVQNNQYSYSGSRTPNTVSKNHISDLSYTTPRLPNGTPKKNQNQYYVSEPSSAFTSRSYYHFLDEYSSSFMKTNSSSPSQSPRYLKYGNGRNSYYYTEFEPRVSKHFSPSQGSSSPITPDKYEKHHTSPPIYRYHHIRDDDLGARNSQLNQSFNSQGKNLSEIDERRDSERRNLSGDYERRNLSGDFERRNLSESDKRKSVGIQRTNAGKYQYEEEPFKGVIEEEEEVNDDIDINSELRMTASTISDVFDDEQLSRDRELLNKYVKSDFHHDRWNGEAEPNPQIDDTKLDQRVQMIISKLKEQNSLSAQNSQLNSTIGNSHINNNYDDTDNIIFLNNEIDKKDATNKPNFDEKNANIAKQNIQKIYSTDSTLPQNLAGTQMDVAFEAADKITHDTNQKIINLNSKNNP
ncbi:hypothetical protein M9Y10_041253 [Tritrichomonas musculus]|uniref:Uncharacterized protein n=1 Tax=Tritrichomonas musculus TaxID=1915356 RepID=A0ABR2K3Y5_9EUKA